MKRLATSIPDELYKAVLKLAEKEGRSLSSVIRRALEKEVKK